MRRRAVIAAPVLMLCATHGAAQLRAPTFDGIDADKSGGLSKEEVVEFFKAWPNAETNAPKLFTRMDANGDGAVSRQEFVAYESRPRPPPSPGGAPPAR